MNAMLRGLVRSDGQLLIVGAGTGAEILEFGKTNPDWRFLGVDPAQAMLDVAKEKIEDYLFKNLFAKNSCRIQGLLTELLGESWRYGFQLNEQHIVLAEPPTVGLASRRIDQKSLPFLASIVYKVPINLRSIFSQQCLVFSPAIMRQKPG